MSAGSPARFSFTAWLPLLLSVGLVAAYWLLPFVTQPLLGPSTIAEVNASRDANELDLETNGVQLVLFAALITGLAGVWGLFNPKLNRAVAAVTALGGILVLTYFAVFFLEYVREGGGYLGAMGAGFWLLLGLSAVMVLQPLLPRPDVPLETRLGSLMANQESAIILALVLLVVAVGLSNPRFFSRAQPARHLAGQRLHRRRRYRHVDGHYHRQHRHLGGVFDRALSSCQRASGRR